MQRPQGQGSRQSWAASSGEVCGTWSSASWVSGENSETGKAA